ncbi:zinc-finger associated domain (zf-AD) domain-containing protein [Phthorimaea operculella]|nr:zinc-finger associated domain (zf-AD) domain-containing protein [Phthorimaea operculella]
MNDPIGEEAAIPGDMKSQCRCCLWKLKKNLMSQDIFELWAEEENSGTTIAAEMAKIANVEIADIEGYPRRICFKCLDRLKSAIPLVKDIRKTQAILRSRLSSVEHGTDETWPKPIDIDRSLSEDVLRNSTDMEIKEEVVSDEECRDEDVEMEDALAEPEIKVEPEEMVEQPAIQVTVNDVKCDPDNILPKNETSYEVAVGEDNSLLRHIIVPEGTNNITENMLEKSPCWKDDDSDNNKNDDYDNCDSDISNFSDEFKEEIKEQQTKCNRKDKKIKKELAKNKYKQDSETDESTDEDVDIEQMKPDTNEKCTISTRNCRRDSGKSIAGNVFDTEFIKENDELLTAKRKIPSKDPAVIRHYCKYHGPNDDDNLSADKKNNTEELKNDPNYIDDHKVYIDIAPVAKEATAVLEGRRQSTIWKDDIESDYKSSDEDSRDSNISNFSEDFKEEVKEEKFRPEREKIIKKSVKNENSDDELTSENSDLDIDHVKKSMKPKIRNTRNNADLELLSDFKDNLNEPIEFLLTPKKKLPTRDPFVIRTYRKYHGLAYRTEEGKIIPKKEIGPPCTCKKNCATKITEEQRQQIFKHYWGLGKRLKQREFVKKFTAREYTDTCILNSKKRLYSLLYFLPITNVFDSTDTKVRVCKKMFSNTLACAPQLAEHIWKKIGKGDENDIVKVAAPLPIPKKSGPDPDKDNTLLDFVYRAMPFEEYMSHFGADRDYTSETNSVGLKKRIFKRERLIAKKLKGERHLNSKGQVIAEKTMSKKNKFMNLNIERKPEQKASAKNVIHKNEKGARCVKRTKAVLTSSNKKDKSNIILNTSKRNNPEFSEIRDELINTIKQARIVLPKINDAIFDQISSKISEIKDESSPSFDVQFAPKKEEKSERYLNQESQKAVDACLDYEYLEDSDDLDSKCSNFSEEFRELVEEENTTNAIFQKNEANKRLNYLEKDLNKIVSKSVIQKTKSIGEDFLCSDDETSSDDSIIFKTDKEKRAGRFTRKNPDPSFVENEKRLTKNIEERGAIENEIGNMDEILTDKLKRPTKDREIIMNYRKNRGWSYVKKNGDIVPKKTLGAPCNCKKMKCESRISQEQRQNIFDHFWSLGDRKKQMSFVLNFSARVKTSLVESKRDGFCIQYYLPLSNEFGKAAEKVRVCKKMFLNTIAARQSYTNNIWHKIPVTKIENQTSKKTSIIVQKQDNTLIDFVYRAMPFDEFMSHFSTKKEPNICEDASEAESANEVVKKHTIKKRLMMVARRRLNGKRYMTLKGKIVGEKVIGPPCNCPARKCTEKISQEQREYVFRYYWNIEDIAKKRAFIVRFTAREGIRRRKAVNSRREYTFKHYLPLTHDFDGEKIQIRAMMMARWIFWM